MVLDKKKLEEIVKINPPALLLLKNREDIQYAHSMLPYSIGIEIECDWITVNTSNILDEFIDITYLQGDFQNIPNIMAVDCSPSEKRFRIPNGIAGLLCLYEICKLLKSHCLLNPGSGIHYHVDCTEVKDQLHKHLCNGDTDWILKELDSWEYKGKYNGRKFGEWFRVNFSGQTLEFRIGEMSFDYEVLIKRILHCTSIVKRIKNEIFGIKEEVKEDPKQVVNNRIIKL